MSRLELHLDDRDLEHLAELVAERLGAAGAAPEPWVGVPEAAAHLACKPQRIYNLVHARAIPHRKDGSRVLLRLSELDRWLDGRAAPLSHTETGKAKRRGRGSNRPPAGTGEEAPMHYDRTPRAPGRDL